MGIMDFVKGGVQRMMIARDDAQKAKVVFKHPDQTFPFWSQLTVDAATALGSSEVPTLVIWGAGDPYVPVRFAEMQTRYFPGAAILVLPESGHYPQFDDPDAVLDAVVPFLRANVTRSTS